MPDAHEIVAEINAFLDSKEAKSPRELAALASAYAALCEEANTRLRRCADFLRRGLRSEAIYHAEIQPDLLDLAAALDLPRLADWNAICFEQQLERARPLLVEVAKELNQVYAAEKGSADGLLSQLRLMSLARAPLQERLKVLCALAGLDPANAQLEKDVRDFEAARLDEIGAEARKAFGARDLGRLRALVREMTEATWHNAVPAETIGAVSQQARQVEVYQAGEALRALLPALHSAYSALSYDECKALLGQWQKILSTARVSAPADVEAQVQPIVNWAAGVEQERLVEQQFVSACSALQGALEDKVSMPRLTKLYTQACAFDQPLPEELVQAYRGRVAELELAQRRRHRVLFALGAAAVLAVGGVVGFLVDRGIVAARVETVVAQVRGSIAAFELEQAAATIIQVEKDEPRVFADPAVQAVKRELEEAIAKDQERQRTFHGHLTRARVLIEEQSALPPLEALERLDQAAAALAEAEKIKRLPQETTDCAALRTKCRACQDAREAVINGEFKTLLAEREKDYERLLRAKEEIEKRTPPPLRDLPATPTVLLKARVAALGDATKGWQALLTEFTNLGGALAELERRPRVGDEHKQAASMLTRKITEDVKAVGDTIKIVEGWAQQARDEVAKREAEERAIDDLAYASQAAADLQKALNQFIQHHPNSAKTPAFKKAAEEAGAWAAVEKWQALVDSWQKKVALAKAADIEARATAANTYLTDTPLSPIQDLVRAYLEYLNRADKALKDGGPWHGALRNLIVWPVMRVHAFKTADGRTYYVPETGKVEPNELERTVSVILDPANVEKLTPVAFGPRGITEGSRPSPQADLAVEIEAKLSGLDIASWDTFGLDIAQMIKDARGVDPIQKGMLLVQVLPSVMEAGWGASDEVTEEYERIKGLQPLSYTGWMNPRDERANPMRPRFNQAIAEMKSFADLKGKVRKRRQVLFDSLILDGWKRGVAVKMDGEWQVLAPQNTLLDGYTLWIVANTPDGASRTLVRIGTVKEKDGTPKPVVDGQTSALTEGTMVFIRRLPAE